MTSLLLLIILVATYSRHKETLKSESTTFSLVRQDDTLEVLLSSHSSDFFIYKGTPIGFQYELLKEFEKASGRVINLTINHDSKEAYKEILKPHYDIIAADIRKSGLVSSFLTFFLSTLLHLPCHFIEKRTNIRFQYSERATYS